MTARTVYTFRFDGKFDPAVFKPRPQTDTNLKKEVEEACNTNLQVLAKHPGIKNLERIIVYKGKRFRVSVSSPSTAPAPPPAVQQQPQ